MAVHKRALEDTSSTQKPKKSKTINETGRNISLTTTAEEVDFPRGGGTTFTPLEVKTIRAEAVKEANEELFEVCVTEVLYHYPSATSASGRAEDQEEKTQV